MEGEIQPVAWTIGHGGGGVEEVCKIRGNAGQLSGSELDNRRW
jgi:hypothetical protein